MDRRLILSLLCIFAANGITTPEDIVPEAQEVQRVRGASALLDLISISSSSTDGVAVPDSIKKAAGVVLRFSKADSDISRKARQVIAGTATAATAELVVDAFDQLHLAPGDVEVTSEDLDRLTNKRTKSGHLVRMEEAAKGAYQGDMMPANPAELELWQQRTELIQTGEQKTSYGVGKPWSNGVMKYCFHSGVTQAVKDVWALAIKQTTSAVPCITFKDVGYNSNEQKCSADLAVFVRSDQRGCSSGVGEGSYVMSLQTGCDSLGTVLHEIGHALGMDHEQSRPDRDEYITVHMNRVNRYGKDQFSVADGTRSGETAGDASRAYDIMSLMHYGINDFNIDKSKNAKPVIEAKPKAYAKYTTDPKLFKKFIPGNRAGFSQYDADQLADHYKSVVPTCKANELSTDPAKCIDKTDEQVDVNQGGGKMTCTQLRAEQKGDHIETKCGGYASGNDECCECLSGYAGGTSGHNVQAWKPPGAVTAKPAPPVKPAKPVKPAQPAKPVKPAQPAKPVKPAQKGCDDLKDDLKDGYCSYFTTTDCTDFGGATDCAKTCCEKSKPSKPVKPAQPAKPVKPAQKSCDDLKDDLKDGICPYFTTTDCTGYGATDCAKTCCEKSNKAYLA